jgi:hypothetical protein
MSTFVTGNLKHKLIITVAKSKRRWAKHKKTASDTKNEHAYKISVGKPDEHTHTHRYKRNVMEENTAVMSFVICIRHQTHLSGQSKDNEMTGQVPPTKICM